MNPKAAHTTGTIVFKNKFLFFFKGEVGKGTGVRLLN